MSAVETPDLRMQELAAGFTFGDLTEAEWNEIKSYDQETFQAMVERSEEAAARTFLTFQGTVPSEPMPAELSSRLKRMASGYFAQAANQDSAKVTTIAPSTMGLREITAWLCMAASIALALCVWLPGKRDVASLQQQRDSLIASATDILRSKWESTAPDPKPGVELGEVAWSTASQQGFMTIRGLTVNDATKEQYQLWIIDPSRDEKPVDGGVFDITSAGESIVPIRAKLRVDKPTVFAITVEKPGGVVVSDQKRLPLIAKLAIQ